MYWFYVYSILSFLDFKTWELFALFIAHHTGNAVLDEAVMICSMFLQFDFSSFTYLRITSIVYAYFIILGQWHKILQDIKVNLQI